MRTFDMFREPSVRDSSPRSQWVVGRSAPLGVTKLRYEVVAVFGPTASGKSAVAQALATRLGTEVVSADALQVYRGMPILTNQPSEPTRLVAIRELADTMSVGEYAPLAHAAIDELVDAHGVAVVAGGTGLYLRSALGDLDIPPAASRSRRTELERLYDAGPGAAYDTLAELDPVAADAIHVNDRRRVVRALELVETGSSLAPSTDRLWSQDMRRPSLVVGLDVPPSELDRRIIERTDEMIARGVVEEARAARNGEPSPTAEKALGLDELATLPLDEARARVVERTRRYAAYQRKWMRRIPGVVMIDADRPAEQVVDAILDVARSR
jgi:tRNA dimethylallyltransferase